MQEGHHPKDCITRAAGAHAVLQEGARTFFSRGSSSPEPPQKKREVRRDEKDNRKCRIPQQQMADRNGPMDCITAPCPRRVRQYSPALLWSRAQYHSAESMKGPGGASTSVHTCHLSSAGPASEGLLARLERARKSAQQQREHEPKTELDVKANRQRSAREEIRGPVGRATGH